MLGTHLRERTSVFFFKKEKKVKKSSRDSESSKSSEIARTFFRKKVLATHESTIKGAGNEEIRKKKGMQGFKTGA